MPRWGDRVLFNDQIGKMTVISYQSGAVKGYDRKPVLALFRTKVQIIDKNVQ